MESLQTSFCKKLLSRLGNKEKIAVIESSNLNARERKALISRYADGETVKDVASKLGMEVEAYNKMQCKAMRKLYSWLAFKANQNGLSLESIFT